MRGVIVVRLDNRTAGAGRLLLGDALADDLHMSIDSAEKIAQTLFDLKLINDRQLKDIWAMLGSRSVSLEQFSEALLGREFLTGYQLNRVLRGEKKGFFFGEYKILYLVDRGSFARVYRAVHHVTGEVVALKIMRRSCAKDTHKVEDFRREGTMGMTLRHPNIVSIFEIVSHEKRYFLVMEFIEGRNLREFIKIRGRCEPDEAIRLMKDVAAALDYAQRKGVTHRDIKLSNVLVSGRGIAKLADFGLAGGVDRIAGLTEQANPRTIDYAALERSTGVRRDDPRTDIYFTGCMLYHLLCGQAPLSETKNRMNRLNKERFINVKPLHQVAPQLPRSILAVVAKAMEIDPERRYQSPKELLIDLDAAQRTLIEPDPNQWQHQDDDTVIEEEESLSARRTKPQRSVMLLEAEPKMQNMMRSHLKSHGFRVLMTEDPRRALGRFNEETFPAQCLVFSAVELGEKAVEAYEMFTSNPATMGVPAILLLGKNHEEWIHRTDGREHHVVLQMPITVGKFREVLDHLVPHAIA